MATIYLHAGMPKTGTSHIQMFLYENEEALNHYGYTFPHLEKFPRIGKGRNAHFLRQKIYNEQGQRDLDAEKELVDRYFDAIAEAAHTFDRVILSEEALWNSEDEVWTTYIEGAKIRNLDTKIIVYLRRQDLFLQSLWAQRVKERSSDTFAQFVESGQHLTMSLDYYKRLEQLSSWFGKDNLIVRVYEKEQYEGVTKDLTSDFLKVLGIELDDRFVIKKTTINPSLTGIYLEVKRLMNSNPEIAIKQSFVHKLMIRLMRKKDDVNGLSSGIYYSGEDQKKFLAAYLDGNEKVAREYLHREDGRLFLAPMAGEDSKPPVYTADELVGLCGELLVLQRAQYESRFRKLRNTLEEQDALLEKKEELLARNQEVIDRETTPFSRKVIRKLKKIMAR